MPAARACTGADGRRYSSLLRFGLAGQGGLEADLRRIGAVDHREPAGRNQCRIEHIAALLQLGEAAVAAIVKNGIGIDGFSQTS